MNDKVRASDLVGCRYRLRQKRAHPDIPPTAHSLERAARQDVGRAAAWEKFPHKSDSRRVPFRRVDLGELPAADPWERELATLEAIAAGDTHIVGACLSSAEGAEHPWRVEIDLLLRTPEGTYIPVIVSNHRVARPHPEATTPGVPTHRLGLSQPLELNYKPRHHTVDGYRLGLAARSLEALGVDSGRGAAIGQDRGTAFFTDTARYQPALQRALDAPLPTAPRRVKECDTCRFWPLCEKELRAADDLSLYLPGDRGDKLRDEGIDTVQALIDAHLSPHSELAAAWRAGVPLLKRPGAAVRVPRADVEVDIDMEAYLDEGAYLWGALDDAGRYHPFVTWEPLGGKAEAANFAEFWDWLMATRAQAHAAGQTFAAYCFAAGGENHWMRQSSARFEHLGPGQPSRTAVEEFIASDEWVDVFRYVRREFAGPRGIGLKVVAPEAGFTWAQGDFDGEESVRARRIAVRGDDAMRRALLQYNADDARATRAIREWMDRGAPGIRTLGTPEP